MIVVTVRLIRSFTHKNVKLITLRLNEDTTIASMKDEIKKEIEKLASVYAGFKKHPFDTLKIYSQPQVAKTQNLIINVDNDGDHMLNDMDAVITSCGVQNGTDISYFNWKDYQSYLTES